MTLKKKSPKSIPCSCKLAFTVNLKKVFKMSIIIFYLNKFKFQSVYMSCDITRREISQACGKQLSFID
jgi:hypothetical protein